MNAIRQALAKIIEMASKIIDRLDDDTLLALTDLILGATEKLREEKEGLEPPINPPTNPDDKLTLSRPMPSSNVHSFAYDDKNQQLLVRFQDKWPNQNGPVYAYQGVPKNIFQLFQAGAIPARTDGQNKWGKWWKGKVPSLGASLYTLIKTQNYPYQKLT